MASKVSATTASGERQRAGRLATAGEHSQCNNSFWRATASWSLSDGLARASGQERSPPAR
ncbi:hypothetical protein A2U01_0040786 [Trifolium medium]|uniref:Uncharacterized protein n=1 Tax=Trifolium medium TaxID=97028 RepID=A0A392Q6W1_9FABA|nr:hypothetical protein [Trifolium medium]